MFQIVEVRPTYCQITDGLIGSSAHPRPMAYLTEAFAHKLAGKLHQENYEGCGDSSFQVVRYGDSVYSKPLYQAWVAPASDEEIPF